MFWHARTNRMTDLVRLRELFDELVDTAPDFQAARISQLHEQDAALAAELAALLQIENAGAPPLTQGVKQSMMAVMDRAETAGYVDKQVGRYRLVSEIGRGGMGVVFKAVRKDGDLEQFVALKMLRKGLVDQKSIDRFHRERKFLANLQHPNICGFIDSGTAEDGTPYLVLELLEGQDLLHYASEQQLNIEQRVRLFQQVLNGVAYAHRSLVIHRDLKPSNIIVDQHGTPKLLDFGIANNAEPAMAKETERWFTAQYGAPEQILGKHLTTSCDLYSLGVILFELLAERSPFELDGKTAAEIENQIVNIPAPLMRLNTSKRGKLNSNRADELDCIVQKAMRKEPNARYQTADEFSLDLDSWLTGLPVRAKGSHTTYRIKKFVQRHRAMVLAAATIAAIVISSIVQITKESAKARSERDRATLALSILTDAFVAADPLQSSKGEMTVRSVLKSSADQLLKLEEKSPQDFVQLGTQIAAVQIKLGLTKDGQNLANRAYDKAVLLGDEESRVALNRLRIRSELVLGNPEQAKRFIAQETNPTAQTHPEFLLWKADTLRYRDSEIAEKQLLLEASVEAFENQLEHPSAITAHTRLAELHYRANRAQQATETAKTALKKFQLRFDDSHPSVVRAQFYQLSLKEKLGQDENVISEALNLMPTIRRTFGENSTIMALMHSLLAHSYRKVNQPREAVNRHRMAVEVFRAALGNRHESTLREHFNVAVTLKSIKDAKAETIAEFKELVGNVMASQVVADDFRHYTIASAALYFREIGEFNLALDTLAHSNYKRDLTVLSEVSRKDFAQDLLLIATDAGCVIKPGTLCYADPSEKCQLAVERYCALNK
jgi:eukaryotic-like serine/threonine-protein kinase